MQEFLDLTVVPFNRQTVSQNHNHHHHQYGNEEAAAAKARQHFTTEEEEEGEEEEESLENNKKKRVVVVRYRECMRNHAASIGGHAKDGCGEYMAGSAEGEFSCGACGCHRNFHRRDADHFGSNQQRLPASPAVPVAAAGMSLFYAAPTTTPINMPSLARTGFGTNHVKGDERSETPDQTRGEEDEQHQHHHHHGRHHFNKRFRTKFTQQQKQKMMEFADTLGWRIKRHDDSAISQFCLEIGVKRSVLKVWMHNNKNTLRKREHSTTATTTMAPAPPPGSTLSSSPPSSASHSSSPSLDIINNNKNDGAF